jgi:hypothetical protein
LRSRFLPAALRLSPLFLLACSVLSGPYLAPAPTNTPLPRPTAAPPTAPAEPTALPTAVPSPTRTPAPTATAVPVAHDVALTAADLLLHPDPQLYSGDVVSFEVLAQNPSGDSLSGLPVTIYLGEVGGLMLASGRYTYSGFAQREQATFYWAWDTAGLVGPQTLVVAHETGSPLLAADPDLSNNVVEYPVVLHPAVARPAPEPQAEWQTAQNECCVFHYLTGTAAGRDLDLLMATAQREVEAVEEFLAVQQARKMEFTLLSRLVGHGGFANESIAISYLDRDYAGGDVPQVFRHEAVHLLDRGIARNRPTLMAEGLAVYASGGHFKVEDIEGRAVALLSLNRYIPLAELADNFYPSQHEIGYLEAAGFVKFLVDTFGWEDFRQFYGTFGENGSHSEILDTALRLNFDRSLAEVEADWLASLRAQPVDPALVADVRDTVAFYDTVRRYQQAADPAVHYMTAWLPDTGEMRERGLVADFLRHPNAPANIALETMLIEAAAAISDGDYARAEWFIASTNAVLGAEPWAGDQRGLREAFADPLAEQYLAVAQSALAASYEPQRIAMAQAQASVAAIQDWPALEHLTFAQVGGTWRLSSD